MRHWAPIAVSALVLGVAGHTSAADIGLINVKGAIGPATANYISRAIDFSGKRGDECLIIQLDTPGGSLESTKDIIQKFYASTVPVVVYVAPAGAWAGS